MVEETIEWLESNVAYRAAEFKKGEALYSQGQEIDTLLVVKEGWVQLFNTTSEGQEITLQIGGPNLLFPIVNLFNPGPCPASFRALSNSKVLFFQLKVVERALLLEPKAMIQIINTINRILANMIVFSSVVHGTGPRERVFKFLKHITIQYGEKVEEGYTLPFLLTQNDLAEMLNLSRVTVNGNLNNLEEQGLIHKQAGGHFIVLQQSIASPTFGEDSGMEY
jgi:CRP-like cAMP-binding protein